MIGTALGLLSYPEVEEYFVSHVSISSLAFIDKLSIIHHRVLATLLPFNNLTSISTARVENVL